MRPVRHLPTVYIVDDDPAILRMVEMIALRCGATPRTFDSAEAILDAPVPTQSGCLLLDVNLPDLDGLTLMLMLQDANWQLPAVIMTEAADDPIAAQAISDGALDFVARPFTPAMIAEQIEHAIQHDRQRREVVLAGDDVSHRHASLSTRETQVANHLILGEPTTAIATKLGVSPKAVEFHRANVLMKMQAQSVLQLTRMLLALEA